MKTVKLLKPRGGDPVGGRITVPDEVANELVKAGTAAPDVTEPPKPAPVVVPTVPQAEYDALAKAHADLKAKHDDTAKAAAELDKDNAELSKDNKALAEEVAKLKAELAKKK